MENTITLQQQREMLTNHIAELKVKGESTINAERSLKKIDSAKPTGLKRKYSDGQVYEVFSYYYISDVTGGKRWRHAHFYSSRWGVMESNPYKRECFK